MTIKIFDTKSTIISKNKASKRWLEYNFIYERFSKILFEKIMEIGNNFNSILLQTSDKFEAFEELKKINHKKLLLVSDYETFNKDSQLKLTGPINSIPIKGKYNLIVSNLYLHRINDVAEFGRQIKNLLSENGVFICSYFGGKTLIELRKNMITTDSQLRSGAYQRVIPYIDMIDACNIFKSIGFKEIVSDNLDLKIKYKELSKLLVDIKGMGENNGLLNRNKGLMTKNFLKKLEENYLLNCSDSEKKINVTCEIITLVMWNN